MRAAFLEWDRTIFRPDVQRTVFVGTTDPSKKYHGHFFHFPTWLLQHLTPMAKQRFSAMEREALWVAYNCKCAYTREPVSYADFHIDHILPESLLDDPDQLAKTKSDLNLSPDFDLLGFENLVPCKPQTNLQKGSVIFNPSYCQFFLGIASAKKPKIESLLETINRRNNRGKAIMLL